MRSCINIFQNKGITPLKKRKFDELFISNSIVLKNKLLDYDNIHGVNGLKYHYESEKERKDKETLLKAQRAIEENLDEVKTMNSIVLNAKYAAIRDRQIEEKKMININKKKIEEKLYLIGEYERLKDEINRKRIEQKLSQKKIEDRKVIENQIINNKKLKEEHKKIIQKELEDNLKYQEQIEKEEEERIKKEKEKEKKIIREMIEANKKSLEIKENKKLEEINEDKKILEYNKQKYKEELNKQIELNEIKHLKELELAKLREKQKKFYDNRNVLDEIMMRRAFEEAGRNERKKAKEEMIRYNKLKEDIKNENDKLLESRNKIKMEEAAQMDKEYGEMIKKYKIEIEKEKEKEKKAIDNMLKYKEDLLKMIAIKDEEKKLKRREILEEGKKLKQSQEEYYNRLQKIKARKIDELKNLNVPKKYIYDLEKFGNKKSF